MMGRSQKVKGSTFEREVCRDLSMWISGGTSKHLFWRASQSGGRATRAQKKGENLSVQAGDIAAIDSRGEAFTNMFFVECKFYENLRLDLLIFPSFQGVLGPMWEKCVSQAAEHNKTPMIIVKQNGKAILIGFELQYAQTKYPISRLLPVAIFPRQDLQLYYFSDFLETKAKNLVHGGNDADRTNGRFTSDRKERRRLSVGVL